MNPRIAVLGLLLALIGLCSGQVLVHKNVGSTEIVQNNNVTIIYNLFNMGDSTAYGIRVEDHTWAAANVAVIEGSSSFSVNSLEPGQNTTAEIVVQPRMFGQQIWGPGAVEYQPSEGALQVTSTSTLGLVTVESEMVYNRRTDNHLTEWATFLALCLVPVGLPFFINVTMGPSCCKKTKAKRS